MFDRAACLAIRMAASPRVDTTALIALKTCLADAPDAGLCGGPLSNASASGAGRNSCNQNQGAARATQVPTSTRPSGRRNHRRRAKAAEPSLLAGLLVDARGERLTPSHAVKKGRRYRYYISAALITDAGTDREGWRLAAREIEEAVIRILADALTSPASLVERFGAAGISGDQVRKLLGRAARMAAALGGSPGERAKLVRELVEKIIVDEKTIIIKLRRGLLLGEDVASSASEAASDSAVELTATVAFTRRGAETKLVLPGLAPQKHSSRCDPALIKAIARGRAWFEELVSGRARSLQELAKRDGISRRYIRRLIGLAFLSPQLIEAILQGRQPVALTATRLTELDLPLDWTEQHKLLAG